MINESVVRLIGVVCDVSVVCFKEMIVELNMVL